MQSVALLLGLLHAFRSLHVLLLVERIAKALASLLHLLLNLLVILGNLVFNQYVSTIALLRVAVVNQRVVKGINVSTGLPYRGVHKDSRVDAHDVLVQQYHRFPPVFLNIIL